VLNSFLFALWFSWVDSTPDSLNLKTPMWATWCSDMSIHSIPCFTVLLSLNTVPVPTAVDSSFIVESCPLLLVTTTFLLVFTLVLKPWVWSMSWLRCSTYASCSWPKPVGMIGASSAVLTPCHVSMQMGSMISHTVALSQYVLEDFPCTHLWKPFLFNKAMASAFSTNGAPSSDWNSWDEWRWQKAWHDTASPQGTGWVDQQTWLYPEPFYFPKPDLSSYAFCTCLQTLRHKDLVNFLVRDFIIRNARAFWKVPWNKEALHFPGGRLQHLSKLDCQRGKAYDDLRNTPDDGWLSWFYACPHIMYFVDRAYGVANLNEKTKADVIETLVGFAYAAATANCEVWFEPPEAAHLFQAMWFVFQQSGLRPSAFNFPVSQEVKHCIESGMAQFYDLHLISTSLHTCELTPWLEPAQKVRIYTELLQWMVDGEVALLPIGQPEAVKAGVEALKSKFLPGEWAPEFREIIKSISQRVVDQVQSRLPFYSGRTTQGTASGPSDDAASPTEKTGQFEPQAKPDESEPWPSWEQVTYLVSGDCCF